MAPKRLPTVSFYFRFYGDSFDPDEITRRLGIEPTTQFRPGDPITEDGKGRRRHHGWMVKIGERETLKVDDLLRELRERISVSSETIRQVCNDLNVNPVVVCGVRQHETAETTPALMFPADFVAWVAEIDASIDVDVIL
jgi:Domain of unknown function (DUF4279)